MLSKTLTLNQTAIGTGVYGSGAANDAPSLKICDADFFQGTVQVSIVGTSASVSIWGRAAPTLPWILVVAAITTSGLTTVPVLSEMYASVTAISAATVNVALNYPCNQ